PTTTGTDAAIADITYNGDLAAELSTDTTTEVTAKNAVLTVNGISIQSQTNRVEGAIQGVTLDLAEEGNASVVVARDTGATEKAVNDFVKAYNNLQTVMTDLTKFNGAEANNGQLLGDSALRTVQSRVRSVVTGGVEDGAMRTLRDLGGEFELNGRLKVNDEELSSAVQNNIGALQQFFAGSEGSQGFSARVENTVSLLLNDSGPIKNSITGLQDSQKRIDERFERMEISIDRTIERYRSQFSQLDSMVAQMNSTSSYLMQQFDIMNAQLGRKK
ncbi:MAG: flagellar filament capping protein FliD, partial [Gammaproteobacteria bacterium]|nr:flagellar filament capping protein FliD [Gammaproteobacteria bacterium]